MELKGEGTVEGVTMAYDADVVQKIEVSGKTSDKYTKLPNITWIEQ